jgi:hypothetical protein
MCLRIIKKTINKVKTGGFSYFYNSLLSKIKLHILDKIVYVFYYCYSFLYSRISGNPLVYVVGDSHSLSFRNTRSFLVKHIGPATAYKLRFKENSTISNEQLFSIIKKINKKRSLVLLVFGEVDCRIHIYNNSQKKNKSIGSLIDDTIFSYGEVLKLLTVNIVNFVVCGVPPANTQGNVYHYPYYAAPQVQRDIKKEFNGKIKNFCQDKGYKYLELFNKFSDENGFILDEYKRDDVHLSNKIMKYIKYWFYKEFGYKL